MQEENNTMQVLDAVRLEINPCRKNQKQDLAFAVSSFDMSDRCLEVTYRQVKQMQFLVQHVNQKYGGHIIPVLEMQHYFIGGKVSLEDMFAKIREYLNELIRNQFCKNDQKVYQFIFQQQVSFPHLKRYDKVMEEAAMLSRRYLNSIFTRKQYGEVHIEDQEMLEVYAEFTEFSTCFRAVKEILVVSARQQNLLEDIFGSLREVRGGLGKGIPPIDFVSKTMQKRIVNIQKLIKYGVEAFGRWQVLRQTVRELHCNVNKGLHQQHTYFLEKYNQLKKWTKSLMEEMREVVSRGNELIDTYSTSLYNCKKEQSKWFVPADEEEEQELNLSEELREEGKMERQFSTSEKLNENEILSD